MRVEPSPAVHKARRLTECNESGAPSASGVVTAAPALTLPHEGSQTWRTGASLTRSGPDQPCSGAAASSSTPRCTTASTIASEDSSLTRLATVTRGFTPPALPSSSCEASAQRREERRQDKRNEHSQQQRPAMVPTTLVSSVEKKHPETRGQHWWTTHATRLSKAFSLEDVFHQFKRTVAPVVFLSLERTTANAHAN